MKEAALNEIGKGDKPKALIHDISEMLLAQYANSELLNKYSVYQILMDYWADTMQDDVYVIMQDGWQAAAHIRELQPVKGKDGKTSGKRRMILSLTSGATRLTCCPVLWWRFAVSRNSWTR